MTPDISAPWHKISYDRFFSDQLPQLLAERLPLAGYSARPDGPRTRQVTIEIGVNGHTLAVDYPGLPDMDAQGLFDLDGQPVIVVPVADREELDLAQIKCAGELLYDAVAARLGTPPAEMEWEESLVRAFLPLDNWINAWLHAAVQRFDTTNWHARQTHLRRIIISNRTKVIAPGQMGRVDPFEVPEGPNIGRVFTVALGAEIRDGQIVILDDSPAAGLGPNTACIPFIEHDDTNRLLMGCNMMRQGLMPETPEPAWVQTGREPRDGGPDLWCGRNLLTALIAWGEGSVEDGLVISQSCAARLNYPYPVEPGDKIANRHGTKGVISQILPDAQMPHLPDGTPVEMCFSFSSLYTRCNIGQILETVMGRIAQAEGRPAIVPSYQAPSQTEIQARLAQAGLPQDGMQHLLSGKDGPELPYASTVGWIYWYRLAHLARPKIQVTGANGPREQAQSIGELELRMLRKAGALTLARASLGEGSFDDSPDGAPTAYFTRLAQRLAAAGISAEIETGQLHFKLTEPREGSLALARPMPHPWLSEHSLSQIGRPPAFSGSEVHHRYTALSEANEDLARRMATGVPARLVQDAGARAETALADYLDALLPASALRVSQLQRLSARAVISPAVGLHLDQIGLPDAIAEAWFGETARTAGTSLQEAIRDAWVIVLREPAILSSSLVAFHPVLIPGPSIRLQPQACELLNTDFDGDQLAAFLPISQAGQAEAGAALSVAAHITRDPALLDALIAPHEGLWGLAWLSLDLAGREQIAARLGCPTAAISGPLTRAEISAALRDVFERDGAAAAILAAEQLMQLGYSAAAASGASLHPFARAQTALPPQPASDDIETWAAYLESRAEAVLSGRGYRDSNLGPQLLSSAIPVRPRSRRLLPILVGARGPVTDETGQTVIVRRSLIEGLSPREQLATTCGARQGLARIGFEIEAILNDTPPFPGGDTPFSNAAGESGQLAYTVLARARRARRPGIVFATAAARGEVDPLRDEESRLLTGLLA